MALSNLTKLWEGDTAHFENARGNATVVYETDWSNRATAKNDLIGVAHSDYSWLYCSSVNIEKLGDASDAGGPHHAKITATFTDPTTTGELGGQVGASNSDWSVWTEHWEGSGEAVTLGKKLKWSDAATWATCSDVKKDAPVFMYFPSAVFTLSGTTNLVDATSKALISALVGKLNASAVTIKGTSYPAQTLLFLGADLQEGADSAGASIYNVTYKFMQRPNTWNKWWNDRKTPKAAWQKIILSDSTSPYLTGLFSDLDPKEWI